MARLIDADALREGFEAADFDDDPFENCDNAARIVRNAPTIDAIPVEWLEKKRKEALQEGMRPDEVDAVEMVMWMWQKEQEARNESKI